MSVFAKFSSWLAAVAFLCLCPLLMYGQDTMQNDQSGMGQKTASTHHMINVTGCLKKGSEPVGYYITDQNGTTWELSSKTVDLSEHVNHVVSVAGHEMPRQVERWIVRPIRIGRSNDIARRRRRRLSTRHGIDQVVNADDLDVYVTARGVNQVIAADREQVAIAGVNHHVQLGVRQLQTGGERNGAAVGGVERVLFDVASNASGAADTGDNGDVPGVDLGIDERVGE